MKVLLIDPWGTDNTAEYLNGLIYGVGKWVDLEVYTNHGFMLENNVHCKVNRGFFKFSDYMSKGYLRTIIRGIEYVKSYIEILNIIRKEKFNVVHINWLLMYKIDALFLPLIKKHCNKLVYTAHNVLPHTKSNRYIKQLNRIYSIVDVIIVHGNSIKSEFNTIFPGYKRKLYVQYHGANVHSKVSYDATLVEPGLREIINGSKRVYVCFGKIFYNKGIDRMIRIWLNKNIQSTLIIAGKINENYEKLQLAIQDARKEERIVLINHFVDDNTLNYIIDKSNIIVLPYRHASMSGVVFTAADFGKTLLTTDVGAILEYLSSSRDSFVCENNDESIAAFIEYIENTISNDELKRMGINLRNNIKAKCSWNNIGEKIVNEVYKGE